jgi:hypothetical protein
MDLGIEKTRPYTWTVGDARRRSNVPCHLFLWHALFSPSDGFLIRGVDLLNEDSAQYRLKRDL